MSTNHHVPWLDAQAIENWRNFPRDELARYAGQHVAYSWDGTRILASAPSREGVEQQLLAAGINPAQVLHAYVDPLDLTDPS